MSSQGIRSAAFSSDLYQKGLDLRRSRLGHVDGTLIADPAATIRPGAMVANGAAGVVQANLVDVIGVAKWGKQQFGYSTEVDEAIVLNGTTATALKRANVSNVAVRTAAGLSGTPVGAAQYTVSTTNGTIARVGGSTIADGATVYVSYTWALTAAQYQFDGLPFHQQFGDDYVSSQENRIAVIDSESRIFSVEWNTSVAYAITGASSLLYCDANGRFSSTDAGTADFVGKVIQLPNSEDRFMGIKFNGVAVIP